MKFASLKQGNERVITEKAFYEHINGNVFVTKDGNNNITFSLNENKDDAQVFHISKNERNLYFTDTPTFTSVTIGGSSINDEDITLAASTEILGNFHVTNGDSILEGNLTVDEDIIGNNITVSNLILNYDNNGTSDIATLTIGEEEKLFFNNTPIATESYVNGKTTTLETALNTANNKISAIEGNYVATSGDNSIDGALTVNELKLENNASIKLSKDGDGNVTALNVEALNFTVNGTSILTGDEVNDNNILSLTLVNDGNIDNKYLARIPTLKINLSSLIGGEYVSDDNNFDLSSISFVPPDFPVEGSVITRELWLDTHGIDETYLVDGKLSITLPEWQWIEYGEITDEPPQEFYIDKVYHIVVRSEGYKNEENKIPIVANISYVSL